MQVTFIKSLIPRKPLNTPKLWNDLPLEIRTAPTLSLFKMGLKTYLFQKSFPP